MTPTSEPGRGRTGSHEVRIVDGRFVNAECSCGWRGAGRRNRATARDEARDHALLYADGRELEVAELEVAVVERAAVEA